MNNDITPNYLNELVPQQIQPRYHLRNSSNIPAVPCRTQLYSNSYLPSTIRDWNKLPENNRLDSFKARINKNVSKASPLFNVGSRQGQVLHTRLRLSCSSLNYDIHRRSLIDSPNCTCGSTETVSHFLLYCQKYEHQRQLYFTNLPCPPIVENLLLGNERLNYDQNKYIFLQVQKFIQATKRF